MTRSLLLSSSFPPALGGVETLLYETNRRLVDRPLVLAPAPAASSELCVRAVRTDALARLAYRPLWRLHPSLHYLQAFWRPALRAAGDWRPAVIQAGHIYLAPLARMLGRRLRLPYVVYAYGQEVWRGGRPMGAAALDQRLRGAALRRADRVLLPGTFTAALLDEWSVPPQKLVRVPYGAEPCPAAGPGLAEGPELAHGAPGAPEDSSLLTVARLVPRKGIDTVIRALRHLPPNVAYRVVGSGPDAARLQHLAHDQGVVGRVTFLGRVSDDQLADEYRRCSVFVLPARRTREGELEGYGLVYFEAAAWGRPVVAGRSGGEVDAVVDGETGLLVDGTSVEAVAAALGSLLADPARRATLGAAGRRRVETTHNWTRAAAVVDVTLVTVAELG